MAEEDPYANVQVGKLKLKGKLGLNDSKRKKKKVKTEEPPPPPTVAPAIPTEEEEEEDAGTQEKAKKLEASMTEAERAFELAQRKREKERIAKIAAKSHREKIEALNKHLDSLPTHFDIPKVGPG